MHLNLFIFYWLHINCFCFKHIVSFMSDPYLEDHHSNIQYTIFIDCNYIYQYQEIKQH